MSTVELIDPGQGQLVIATSASDGATLDDYAARHEAEVTQKLPGYRGGGLDRSTVAGVEVLARRYSWQPDEGARIEQVTLYRLARGFIYVAVLTTREAASATQVERASQVIATLAFEDPPAAREYSVAELTALAEIAGAASFPGTGGHTFEDAQTRAAAKQALLARGAIRGVDGQGRAHLDAVDGHLLLTALRPDAIVEVEHRRAQGRDRLFVYVRPTGSVAHRAGVAGIHRLESLPTSLLAETVGRLSNLVDRQATREDPIAVSADTFLRLRAASQEPTKGAKQEAGDAARLADVFDAAISSSRVRITSGESRPGETAFRWLDCGDRGLWLVTPADDQVTVRPVGFGELTGLLEPLRRFSEVAGAGGAAAKAEAPA